MSAASWSPAISSALLPLRLNSRAVAATLATALGQGVVTSQAGREVGRLPARAGSGVVPLAAVPSLL
jgi:hypothetical protein